MFVESVGNQRIAIAGLAIAIAMGLMMLVGAPAHAQDLTCEKVTYNESVVIKCESTPDGADGASSGSSSTPPPDSADDSPEDNGPLRSAAAADDEDRIDRGDRGSRRGVDVPQESVDDSSNAGSDETPSSLDEDDASVWAGTGDKPDKAGGIVSVPQPIPEDAVLDVTQTPEPANEPGSAGRIADAGTIVVARAGAQTDDRLILSVWGGILALGGLVGFVGRLRTPKAALATSGAGRRIQG